MLLGSSTGLKPDVRRALKLACFKALLAEVVMKS
jgi:hypothetical protein